MKLIKLWLGVVLFLGLMLSPGESLAATKETFETKVLKNGVTFKYKVMKDQPMVSINAVFPVGFSGEKAKGIAHLLEHLVFRGGSGYDFNDIAGVTTRKGGYFNGFTSFYATSYNYVTPKEQFNSALEVFNGCLWGLDLVDELIEMEKEIIVKELDMGYANRYQYYPMIKYFYPEMFHSKETLGKISAEDLQEFYLNYYQPDRVTYVIAGDIDPEQVAAELENISNFYGYREAVAVETPALDFPEGISFEERNLYPFQHQLLNVYQLSGLNERERMVLKLLSYMYGNDYKIDYLENRYKVYSVITRSVGDQDYFGVYYMERDNPYSEAQIIQEQKNLQRYFHEFRQIDFKRELKNFRTLIELEALQSQQSAEAAVAYEVQRLTDPDNITIDSLKILKKLKPKDLATVLDRYFNRDPDFSIVVKTTK